MTAPAPVVRVATFVREGTGWLGGPPELHPITITDVSGGLGLGPGTQFDWFCALDSCRLICEGLPNGDSHPSLDAVERDAVGAHLNEGVDLCWRSAVREPKRASSWDERPF